MKTFLACIALLLTQPTLVGQQTGTGSSSKQISQDQSFQDSSGDSLTATGDPAYAVSATSCKATLNYLESSDGLLGDWDRTFQQRAAYENGLHMEQKILSTLLSDSWWAASSGPVVANQIRGICSTFADFLGTLSPAGNPVRIAESFGKEVSRRSNQILGAVGKGGDLYDSVRDGTSGLALFGVKLAAEQAGMGRAMSALGVLQDVQATVETSEDLEKAKNTVRQQAAVLNAFIVQFENRKEMETDRLEAMEGLREAVNKACSFTQSDAGFSDVENPKAIETLGLITTPTSAYQPLPQFPTVAPVLRTPSNTGSHPAPGNSACKPRPGDTVCR